MDLELNDLDELLESAKLGNRRSLSRLISRIESYVVNKKLSYKREDDVVQILDYAFNL